MSSQPTSCAMCNPVQTRWRSHVARAVQRIFSSWSWETLSTSGYFDMSLAGQAAFSYEAEARDNDVREMRDNEAREMPIARDAASRSAVR